MGLGMKELLIILVIALLVFGTKKLKNLGSDLGGAVKGFKDAMKDGEKEEAAKQLTDSSQEASKDADFTTTKQNDTTKQA